MDWSGLLRDYGWWFAAAVAVLANAGRIIQAVEKVLSPVVPAIAERVKLRQEREAQMHSEQTRERIDTILMLKDLILQYRNELDDAKTERRRAENEAISVVRGYERLSAQVVEVLRDISEAIRANTARLDKLQETQRDRFTHQAGND